jgi:hypothetical protein
MLGILPRFIIFTVIPMHLMHLGVCNLKLPMLLLSAMLNYVLKINYCIGFSFPIKMSLLSAFIVTVHN